MRRPCGHLLTDRALAWCAFEPGAKLVDVGCGDGDTVRYIRERYGLEILGLDKRTNTAFTIAGDALTLPFDDKVLDGVFFKCSFSVMDESTGVLHEARRVLKPGGWLAIDDFYARAAEINLLAVSRVLGRIERLETILKRLQEAGFALSLFEDHTHTMRGEWAQAIFENGHDELYDEIAAHREALRKADCGYGLFVARRGAHCASARP